MDALAKEIDELETKDAVQSSCHCQRDHLDIKNGIDVARFAFSLRKLECRL